MSDEQVQQEAAPAGPVQEHDLMSLFDELTFREKVNKIMYGLKQPKDSGDYKWAKLQVIRLWAPTCAILTPLLAVLLLAIFSAMPEDERPPVEVQIMEPEKIEEKLDPIEEKKEEPIEPEPTEMEINDMVSENVAPGPVAAVGPPADFSPQPAQFDSVAIVKSPVIMKGIYGSRSPGNRGSALGRFGGGGSTEGAVLRALRWLKKNQNSDGSWEKTKPAMTGLALLCYLAHGETPSSEEFGPTVERAIRWLVENQDGSGSFKGKDGNGYSIPIAAYALSEAYGLTRVPTIKDSAAKAIDVIIKGQNPTGGWGYNCAKTDYDDTSYMGWCAQALKAAKMAGIKDSDSDHALEKAIKLSIVGFKKNYGSKEGYGGFGYRAPPGEIGLTGVGVLCLQLLGASREPECKGGLAGLDRWTFSWADPFGKSPVYYWYYVTQAKFHAGGDTWTQWNKQFSPELVKNQKIEKGAIEGPGGKMFDIGYWDSPAQSEHQDGGAGARVQNTCLCALMLEVYYRYLPTFQQPEELKQDASNVKTNSDIKIEISI